jgi:hypothetical protein
LIIIKHRVNTIADLIATPKHLGVEIDLRTNDSDLIINHEPFSNGPILSEWLKSYNHKFLILNVKEDGLETYALDLMNRFKIKDFFFLDQSFPSLYKASKIYPNFISVRVSDIESVQTALRLSAGWIWFDSLTGGWEYLHEAFKLLPKSNVMKCLVSPELQRSSSESELLALKCLIGGSEMNFDAVCTKYPKKWESTNL